ncbi:MAG: bifunctional chorismate mutase/prephenate dehydratase [Firmicutes bacterium]|nr:bifunctional chorismate mutase/prephenate dehydratase [Bacillota bacterium]
MNELEKARLEIDEIDEQMAKLFERRMRAGERVARYKTEHALPVLDKAREKEMLNGRPEKISDSTLREYYSQFLRETMRLSREYQYRLSQGVKVAYSGVEGAFSHIAAQKIFPGGEYTPCSDFADAYRAVENGDFDCAVLPVENSYAGAVGAVMDLIFSGSLYINQMIDLDIVHNLLAREEASLQTIKTVVSHPQALAQCDAFIKEHGWDVVAYANTALAAKYVREEGDETVAAVASAETARIFGLQVLESHINASKSNATRFAVFSRAANPPSPSSKNENECFVLVFTVRNEAGALAKALNIIGAHNFNMRALRSRPMKGLLWNYYFYIEAEGNISSQSGQDMLRELSAVCARLRLVGSYSA